MARLEGRIAVVTGAALGNGAGIANVLAKQGALVVLTDIQDTVFDTAKEVIAKGYKAKGLKMDVTDTKQVKAVVDEIIKEFGKIDIFVNNAGIVKITPFIEISDEERDLVFNVNLFGVWNCLKAVLPHMVEKQYGKVINISSVTGPMVVDYGESSYAATKAAVMGLTKSVALEVAKMGITVNAILPGYVDTPMVRTVANQTSADNPQSIIDTIASNIPMGRLALAEELGDLVCFLSSDESRYITGAGIVFDGGSTLPEAGCAYTGGI